MSKAIKTITIETDNGEINIVYKNSTLYFTKTEIASLYGIEKGIIKELIKELRGNERVKYINAKANKIVKIYPLELVILIGYKLKDYTTTRELVKINRIINDKFINKYSPLDLFILKYNSVKNKILFSLGLGI